MIMMGDDKNDFGAEDSDNENRNNDDDDEYDDGGGGGDDYGAVEGWVEYNKGMLPLEKLQAAIRFSFALKKQ